ncbi:MAG TPA: hypothetical protein VFK36_05175 [Gemmatimonadales bacterium]|nr:hypothetical protein [Gemmatimonadales bacterium]
MSLLNARSSSRDSREVRQYDLELLRLDGRQVAMALLVRRSEDGTWRGRLQFTDADSGEERSTAEIFCGALEDDLWHSLQGLREHHIRDLYRSLA